MLSLKTAEIKARAAGEDVRRRRGGSAEAGLQKALDGFGRDALEALVENAETKGTERKTKTSSGLVAAGLAPDLVVRWLTAAQPLIQETAASSLAPRQKQQLVLMRALRQLCTTRSDVLIHALPETLSRCAEALALSGLFDDKTKEGLATALLPHATARAFSKPQLLRLAVAFGSFPLRREPSRKSASRQLTRGLLKELWKQRVGFQEGGGVVAFAYAVSVLKEPSPAVVRQLEEMLLCHFKNPATLRTSDSEILLLPSLLSAAKLTSEALLLHTTRVFILRLGGADISEGPNKDDSESQDESQAEGLGRSKAAAVRLPPMEQNKINAFFERLFLLERVGDKGMGGAPFAVSVHGVSCLSTASDNRAQNKPFVRREINNHACCYLCVRFQAFIPFLVSFPTASLVAILRACLSLVSNPCPRRVSQQREAQPQSCEAALLLALAAAEEAALRGASRLSATETLELCRALPRLMHGFSSLESASLRCDVRLPGDAELFAKRLEPVRREVFRWGLRDRSLVEEEGRAAARVFVCRWFVGQSQRLLSTSLQKPPNSRRRLTLPQRRTWGLVFRSREGS